MNQPVAIVLGAAVWPGGAPSPALRQRAELAARLYREGRVGSIIATGGCGTHPPSEARVIREIVTGLGVPETAVMLEEHSASTLENLLNARALMPPGAQAVIVTDRWHLPRARLTARRLGIPATGAAPSLRGAYPGRLLRAALREAAALTWYLLRPMS